MFLKKGTNPAMAKFVLVVNCPSNIDEDYSSSEMDNSSFGGKLIIVEQNLSLADTTVSMSSR